MNDQRYTGALLALGGNTVFWLLYMAIKGYFSVHYFGAVLLVLVCTGFCWAFAGIRCQECGEYTKYSAIGFFLSLAGSLLLIDRQSDPLFQLGIAGSLGVLGGVLLRDVWLKLRTRSGD